MARANTDTRVAPNVFFRDNTNRQIASNELGGGGLLKDFLAYMEVVSVASRTKRFKS